MIQKILVTGGAGFIGSEFVRQALERGYRVVVIDCLTYAGDKKRLKDVFNEIVFYESDIADVSSISQIFRDERPEIVVHWAAESHVDRSILDASPFLKTNIIGTKTLLDEALRHKVGLFINISTDEVYGELGQEGQFVETTPLNPNSPYSVSKASQDMLGRAYHRTYGLPVITVRPSNNYGYWQYPEKFLPVIIYKAYHDEKIPVYGKGENIREWLHVRDCVNGVFNIIQHAKVGEIYNIGGGNERRNIDVVKAVLKIIGKPESLIEFVADRPGHDFRYSLNCEKIKKQCGWSPQIDFEKGLKETVDWYLENMDWVLTKLENLKEYWQTVYKKQGA
ncbi:MAG: dTDP-glucose 4,6-dehydratase [Thermodesulfovibrionales bacterium]|nr:dTDP-glucose 4,6-dehydratase [Thermodesulfovibrionales bacterium]